MQETWDQFLGREDSPGGGNGNPLQDSCLENPMDRGSLAGCSPQGHKELVMTQQLNNSNKEMLLGITCQCLVNVI